MFKLAAALIIFAPAIASAALCGEDTLLGRLNPLNPWLYGTPYGANVGMRTPTELHANMMVQSYMNLHKGKPIETGVIELLDQSGAILDKTDLKGVEGHILNLNELAVALLLKNFPKLPEVQTLVVGHTHPGETAGNSGRARTLGRHGSERYPG